MTELLKLMDPWQIAVIVSVFGLGGVGIIAYIAQPAKDTIDDLRGEIADLRKTVEEQGNKIAALQTSETRNTSKITALTMHCDRLADLVEENTKIKVERAHDVLVRVARSFE